MENPTLDTASFDNSHMLDMISITLQATIAQLGPLPDPTGDPVKELLKRADVIEIVCLGATLDECLKDRNYDRLLAFMDEVKSRRNRDADL